MAVPDAIEVEGRIVEVLAASLFRVELTNGHRLVAHVSGRRRLVFERLSMGDSVKVRMSPYDLSKGVITVNEA
ncbi:MAG TPA: translation initiation factor IF-1 [Candidatus Baltobacteraceae bacterium]|jgi:translation initiation factor IF-1|nr:translation initiation factor IF-1 [Candidatus Baltobacteraceae bacterium]